MNNNYFNPYTFNANPMPGVIPTFSTTPQMMRGTPMITRGIPIGGASKLSSLFGGSRAVSGAAMGTTSKVTFSSILNGASKTLGVINQAIPVVYQVKPIWKNAKTMLRVARELNSNNNEHTPKKQPVVTKQKEEQKKESVDNSPTFFI